MWRSVSIIGLKRCACRSPPQETGMACCARHHFIPRQDNIDAVATSPLATCPYSDHICSRMNVDHRSILHLWICTLVRRRLRLCQSSHGSVAPLRCLSILRICSACSVLALRSTYSVQGHVWQLQRAACLTRMTWFCIRRLRGASASSIPRCAQKALRPRCCISAINIAGSPLKESGLPSTGMMCSGPLDFTLLPEMTKSSPSLWLAIISVLPG